MSALPRAAGLLLALALAGCAGGPPPPDWQLDAQQSLAEFERSYLGGDSHAAEAAFARARRALAATGRIELVARAELLRCAVRTASLDFDDCPGFAALAADATPQDRTYAAYLAGQWAGLDAALLPDAQRGVPAGDGRTLPAAAGPLPALVAAGALLRSGKIAPAGIAAAVDTASAQGWRRALLAWLGVEEKRAVAAGDTAAAERIRRRINLVGGGASA